MRKKLLYCGLLIFSNTILCSGQSYRLEYSGSAKTLQVLEKFQPLRQQVNDSLAAVRQVNALLIDLYGAGYVSAGIKDRHVAKNFLTVTVEIYEQYRWAYFSAGNVPELFLSKTGFLGQTLAGQPFSYNALKRLFKGIVMQSENGGYPFASVGIDSIQIAGNSIYGVLDYSPGPLITYDSIAIEGTSKVKRKWFSTFLGVPYGASFDQSAVNAIEEKISSLDFLELKAPVQITFQNSEAKILLELSTTKTNQADGIIGFFPNAKRDGRVMLTGQFDLDLRNLFGSGKNISVAWQRLKPLSQFLHIAYGHPNLLGTPLHLSGAYELLKEDSSFINRSGFLTLEYQTSASNFSFFTQMKTSRLINSEHLMKNEDLPELNNFNINYYGFGYETNNYNDSRTIRSGMGAHIEAAAGTKKIKKDVTFPQAVYEGIDLHSFQVQFKGQYQYYFPLSRSLVFHQRLSAGKIVNDRLFINDLFRLGGLNSLRGFNENQFFASDYMLSNLELQLHYESESYVFVFYDQSWLYFDTGVNEMEDYPFGLGAGINFATDAGVVSLAYAIGKSQQQPLNLRISKFHFGYVAKF